MKRRKTKWSAVLRILLWPAAAAAAVTLFTAGMQNLENGRGAENLRQLEDAVRRSCVSCYAAEGAYAPNLEYLEAHYGLQIDKTRYTVFYEAFAENLMPDITVLENEK